MPLTSGPEGVTLSGVFTISRPLNISEQKLKLLVVAALERSWPPTPRPPFLSQYVSWPGILVFAAIAIGTALQLVLPRLSINAAGMSRTVLAVNTVMTYMVSSVFYVIFRQLWYPAVQMRGFQAVFLALPGGSLG